MRQFANASTRCSSTLAFDMSLLLQGEREEKDGKENGVHIGKDQRKRGRM